MVIAWRRLPFKLKVPWDKESLVPKLGLAAAALGVWGFSYHYFTDMIERSSPLVRQTLFNLRQAEQSNLWGDSIRVISRPVGYQSQKQGKAELQFEVGSDDTGFRGTAHVVATKRGWDWQTELLEICMMDGSGPITIIKS